MSKQKIFELILSKNEERSSPSADFPDLIPETCSAVAKSFSKFLYDTVKIKSSSTKEKRSKILKFLLTFNNTSPRDHTRVDESNYIHFLKALKPVFSNNSIDDFLRDATKQLYDNVPRNFAEEVLQFHRRKNSNQRKRIKQLELIEKFDQEKLDSSPLKCTANKTFSTYETSETLITSLLGNIDVNTEDKSLVAADKNVESFDYREKQIRFGYALLNIAKNENEICLIDGILRRLMKYENLEEFEIHFLEYLLFKSDDYRLKSLNLIPTIIDNFVFVIERYILNLCTHIVEIGTEEEKFEFFNKIESDNQFLNFKRICMGDQYLCCKVKTIIHVLYSHSSCNRNLLILYNYFDDR